MQIYVLIFLIEKRHPNNLSFKIFDKMSNFSGGGGTLPIFYVSCRPCQIFFVAHHTWIKFLKSRRNSLMMKNKVTYDRYECTKSK